MFNLKHAALALGLALLSLVPQHAEAQAVKARVVTTCGTLGAPYVAAQDNAVTVDVNGTLCTNALGASTVRAPVTPATATATQSDLIGCQFVAAGVTFTNGQQGAVSCDASGNLMVGGNVASTSADSGNPVKVGGVYRATPPTFSDGQRGDLQLDTRGNVRVSLMTNNSSVAAIIGSNATDNAAVQTGLFTFSQNLLFNGSNYDRFHTINAALIAGTGTAAFALAPTSASTGAITPVVSASVEGSHVLKGSAGNLYSLVVTSGASAGYVMVFNATSAPADGAVTPTECVAIAANSTISINYSGPPEAFATGITAVFSTTGCFTKTISATAFFSGKVA